ncbi:hypothetical protein CC2G_011147 [Coprinopsis cinerea AmutBmut pab1-1]|nr:hypothetical protein CC2G_011147 [Coprinopsis cinerea AmutBmut pab1-1]
MAGGHCGTGADPTCIENGYGYIPSRSATTIMVVFFSISTIVHMGQATVRKQWYLFPTAILCGILEILGWAYRLKSHFEPFAKDPFKIQTIATILGPTPLLAANFVIFGNIIRALGTDYSRITPKWYTIIFCGCDLISLFVQGGGGGVAASSGGDLEIANRGANIMLGGIIFQLVAIVAYSCLCTEYLIRYTKKRPIARINQTHKDYSSRGELTNKLKLMLLGLILNLTFLFIRAIYRVAELSEGWTGRIIKTEVYFNWLDGAMIVLAMYAFNFFHPGWLLFSRTTYKHYTEYKAAPIDNERNIAMVNYNHNNVERQVA